MSQRLVTEIHRGLCSNPRRGWGVGGWAGGLSLSYPHFTIFVVVVAFWLFFGGGGGVSVSVCQRLPFSCNVYCFFNANT